VGWLLKTCSLYRESSVESWSAAASAAASTSSASATASAAAASVATTTALALCLRLMGLASALLRSAAALPLLLGE